MRLLRVLWWRLGGTFNRKRHDRELAEEIESHLQMHFDDNLRVGMTPEEARRDALIKLGGVEGAKERYRRRGLPILEELIKDVRYAWRGSRKNPGFTAVAVFTLALGIGANTAIFSVVDRVLLRPLPYAQPERLVAIGERDTRELAAKGDISYPNFFDWRAAQRSFDRLGVFRGDDFTLTGSGQRPVHLTGQVISPEVFPLLGATPALGRLFMPDEERASNSGAGLAAIISHGLWQRQFGADSGVVGRAITLDGRGFTVVGVMPAGFQFPIQADPVEVWVTSAVDALGSAAPADERSMRWLQGIGRLKPGVSLGQAQAEMDAIAAHLEEQHPSTNAYSGAALVPLHSDLVADYRAALWALFAAVGFVLLIACANVASLLLARATVRHREIAVRAALGASWWRLVRQLLTESIMLAAAGGALGWLLAWWGVAALTGLIPEDVPRLSEISLDLRVLIFTLLASLVTGITFGLAPVLEARKVELTEAMKAGARVTHARRGWLRRALVIVEVALSVMLLIGAGLLGKTFLMLGRVDLGFDARNVLSASIELPAALHGKPQQQADFLQQLLERVRAVLGVASAGAVFPLPLAGSGSYSSFTIEGRSYAMGENPDTAVRMASLEYFSTMKIGLRRGRDFSAQDDLRAPPVAIVNESFARLHFSGEDALGKRVRAGATGPAWREIVGVVSDVRHQTALGRESGAELYVPYAQAPFGVMSLVIRTEGVEAGAVARALQAEAAALDREVVPYEVKTLEQYLGGAVAQPKFSALLFGIFAGVALVLSAVGLYGLMAYAVVQRTHEIGIRMALGAGKGDLLKLIVGQGIVLALFGIGVGMVSAFALTQLMASLLFGVSPTDPVTYVAVSVGLIGVAALACLVPARRASKVDPLVALRYE